MKDTNSYEYAVLDIQKNSNKDCEDECFEQTCLTASLLLLGYGYFDKRINLKDIPKGIVIVNNNNDKDFQKNILALQKLFCKANVIFKTVSESSDTQQQEIEAFIKQNFSLLVLFKKYNSMSKFIISKKGQKIVNKIKFPPR